jgi:2-amino-1-hydroxyethylphosphonate dioxygenase (glycine-forming)
MRNLATLFDLYSNEGQAEYIGEPVSQIEHAYQAALLAKSQTTDNEVIIASFFHDIGHLCAQEDAESMDGFGVLDHDEIGADYLRSFGFSERVAFLVENHVQAKRYLTWKNLDYYDALSDASKETLKFQGGAMSEQEGTLFEQHPDFQTIIQLRKWDEAAKETNIPITDLAWLEIICEQHIRKPK